MPDPNSSRLRLRTASGDITTRPAILYAVPATIGWLRLQELHARAGGGSGGMLAEVAEMTPAQAKTAYHDNVGAALGQMLTAPPDGRLAFFTSLLDHVSATGSPRGLESPYLLGLGEARYAADTDLLRRAEQVWRACWSRERSGRGGVDGALLIDSRTSVVTILNNDDLSALAPGGAFASTLFGDAHNAVSTSSLTVGTAGRAAGSFDVNGWRLTIIALVAFGGAVLGGIIALWLTADTGGMVAAATTSLPERADRDENYDYRYVWIRDHCLAGQAVAAAGPLPVLDSAVEFTAQRLLDHGPDLAPAYTITGDPIPPIRELDLPGYPGARPAAGNRVGKQFQLDIFGEALLLFAAAARHDMLTEDHRRAVELAVSAIVQHRHRPDAGIWEIEERQWTHSRLICAAGLRAVAARAETGADAGSCAALADSLLADAARAGVHPSGRWQRAPDSPGVDAALILPLIRGAVPASDPRYSATFDAVERELCSEFYVYRYRHDQRPLEVSEGAFLLCGFTMSIAAAQLGRPVTAMRYFERNRAACGTPGLFAEEFDVTQRQLRGNLPQAFVHALLLESSIRLADIDEVSAGRAGCPSRKR